MEGLHTKRSQCPEMRQVYLEELNPDNASEKSSIETILSEPFPMYFFVLL